jgi:hypothetical protein
LNRLLKSVAGIFSRRAGESHEPNASSPNHKKKHPIHEPAAPLSTAARVQKAVEHKAGQEKRASEARAAAKKKSVSKSGAKSAAKKKKVKAKGGKH